MRFTRNLLIATLLASGGNAMAASSVDLAVKGSITPSACTPSLANGGVIEFGKFPAKELNYDKLTRLAIKDLQVRVDCAATTFYALQGSDNRAGSAPDSHAEENFGLGLINGDEKLGSYFTSFAATVADGVPAKFVDSFDGGVTWNPWEGGGFFVGGMTAVSNAAFTRIPVKVMTTTMSVNTLIAPANTLTLNNEVPIDGSMTVTVKYL